jgi:hypothetical protein
MGGPLDQRSKRLRALAGSITFCDVIPAQAGIP